ncbi:hypothetical protein HOG48_04775 [Candidatus Peregrinibacteria bacterium]|jgi:hypothetical protein|nr:hypothetical protein [Candidatus Peregrinibacteria bacterium]
MIEGVRQQITADEKIEGVFEWMLVPYECTYNDKEAFQREKKSQVSRAVRQLREIKDEFGEEEFKKAVRKYFDGDSPSPGYLEQYLQIFSRVQIEELKLPFEILSEYTELSEQPFALEEVKAMPKDVIHSARGALEGIRWVINWIIAMTYGIQGVPCPVKQIKKTQWDFFAVKEEITTSHELLPWHDAVCQLQAMVDPNSDPITEAALLAEAHLTLLNSFNENRETEHVKNQINHFKGLLHALRRASKVLIAGEIEKEIGEIWTIGVWDHLGRGINILHTLRLPSDNDELPLTAGIRPKRLRCRIKKTRLQIITTFKDHFEIEFMKGQRGGEITAAWEETVTEGSLALTEDPKEAGRLTIAQHAGAELSLTD